MKNSKVLIPEDTEAEISEADTSRDIKESKPADPELENLYSGSTSTVI